MSAHAGETVSRQVPPKTGGVTFSPAQPKCAETHFLPLEYVEVFSGRERRRCLQIVCRSRMALLEQAPSCDTTNNSVNC